MVPARPTRTGTARIARPNRDFPPFRRCVQRRCCGRWATVDLVQGDTAVVTGPSLGWSGGRLHLGPATTEVVRLGRDGLGLVDAVRPGQLVALHWDWVCDRLTPARQCELERWTRRSLAIANATPTARAWAATVYA